MTDEISKVWEHYLNVVPTRIIVFGPDDSRKLQSANDSHDGKVKEEKNEPNVALQANSIFGNWHWVPIYFFFMFSWLQSRLVSLATTYVPIPDFGHHLLLIGVALLLGPFQFAATLASSATVPSQKTEDVTAKEKKSGDDTKDDSQPSPRMGKTATAVLALRILVAMYSWLGPITILWATSIEITKASALKLSRYFSLTQYAIDAGLLQALSGSDMGFFISKGACVLALYIALWVALALPCTIVLRRVHASEWLEELLRAISRAPRTPSKTSPGYAAAWRSFTWDAYRRLLAVYACSFVGLLLVAAGGMQLSLTAIEVSHSAFVEAEYMGYWTSVLLHLQAAVGRLF